MKKVLYGAAAALVIFAASCSKSDNAADANFFSAQATDSLMTSFGDVVGASLNMQISQAMAQDPTVSKEAFLKGLQYALASDTTESYANGVIVGMQIQRQLTNFSRMGVNVNKSAVLNAFKKQFLTDSVPSQMEMAQLDGTYRHWNDSLQNAKHNYDIAILEKSPEAIENAAAGDAYIKDVVANDDSVKVADSGLAYKIENAGEGEKVNPNKRVIMTYTAKTADGRVVERYNATPMMLANRTQALKEGAAMLGKGGKATLYAPGKLAYGVEAPAHLGIGPNELIIYEIEVVDIPEQAPM